MSGAEKKVDGTETGMGDVEAGAGAERLVRVERRDGIVRLTLDRPAQANALSLAMARELTEAVRAAEADPDVHVLTITGAGRFFCGGGDVAAMGAVPGEDRPAVLQALADAAGEMALALVRSRLVVVAGVNGTTAGAGLGLVVNADLALVREDAAVLTAYTGIGLVPDTGVSWWLPRLVGPARAAELALRGRRLTGAEAVEWGLATEAVPGEDFDARLTALEDELAAGSVHAYGPTKALLRGPMVEGYAEHLDREAAAIAEASGHPGAVRRVDAFLGKG